ncbi:MAG: CvpA family protein [Comamonadaceae bacterium]|jgi:membrane protein required for colicin V production
MPEISLDWIFGAVLLVSLLLGAWRGLIYEVLSLLNWVAAFVLAQWLASDVASKLPMSGASEAIRYAAAFALIFVLSVFVGGLLATLVKKLFAAAGLQAADRALGAVFGLLRGVIVVLVATVIVSMTPLQRSAWWQDSVAAGLAQSALQGLKPLMPQEFGKYLT